MSTVSVFTGSEAMCGSMRMRTTMEGGEQQQQQQRCGLSEDMPLELSDTALDSLSGYGASKRVAEFLVVQVR